MLAYLDNKIPFINLILKKHKNLFIFAMSLFYVLGLFLLSDSFKFATSFSFICFSIFIFISNDLKTSLVIMMFLSGLFFLPAKYQLIEIASNSEIKHDLLPYGAFDYYGLTTSDIFALFLLLDIVFHIQNIRKYLNIRNLFFVFTLISWLLLFFSTIYSSLYYSFFPEFSIFFSIQTLKILLLFLGIYQIKKEKRNYEFFSIAALGLILFQLILGCFQFLFSSTQLFLGNMVSLSLTIPEEDTFFSRIWGISYHANQHAINISLLYFYLLFNKNSLFKKYSNLITGLFLTNIILTQSRGIWLFLFVISIFFFWFSFKKINENVLSVIKIMIRNKVYVLGLAFFVLVIVFPRLSLSRYFFSETGGGALRVKMIADGLQILNESPFFGHGLGSSVRVALDLLPNGYISTFPFPIHFGYLHFSVEAGIVGAFLLFSPIFLLLRKSIIDLLEKKFVLEKFLLFSMIFILLAHYLFQPIIIRTEWIFFALIASIGAENTERISKNKHGKIL